MPILETEALGAALFALSDRMRASGFYSNGDNHAAYERVVAAFEALRDLEPAPVPIRLNCPECGVLHIDEGAFAACPHHTHACQGCGAVWRPAIVPTRGVRFLPGFKNEAGL